MFSNKKDDNQINENNQSPGYMYYIGKYTGASYISKFYKGADKSEDVD